MGALDLFHQIYPMASVLPFFFWWGIPLCSALTAFSAAGISAWHSSSIQISAQILVPVQGEEAYKEQKDGGKRWKGFHLQGYSMPLQRLPELVALVFVPAIKPRRNSVIW